MLRACRPRGATCLPCLEEWGGEERSKIHHISSTELIPGEVELITPVLRVYEPSDCSGVEAAVPSAIPGTEFVDCVRIRLCSHGEAERTRSRFTKAQGLGELELFFAILNILVDLH